jgi:hypothetical protein
MNKVILILIICIIIFPIFEVFAEPVIKISISDAMNKLTLDGKWTHTAEWKHSSHNEIRYEDGNTIHFRSAHQDNFIYFLIDFVSDTSIDIDNDNAILCLEPKNNKPDVVDSNAYCFMTILGNHTPILFQGNHTGIDGFKQIPSIENLFVSGNVSSDGDRYSSTPHTSYEFKIPTDLVGRYSEYGFYYSVYEKNSDKYFTWPHFIQENDQQLISNSSQWGTIISPDKSLPEFNFSIMFLILISAIVVLQVYVKTGKLRIF